MLRGKKILLGISGSIAAYKTTYLVRYLIKEGADVKVIITESAADFVTPVSLSTLSKNPVVRSFYKDKNEGTWNNHVDLGLWADLFIIAPASANTMASMANGICNNVLIAVYLSARCPVWIFPAMDLDMYAHPSTERNMRLLVENGNRLFEAQEGELASGLSGKGRMMEPEEITKNIVEYFNTKGWWYEKKVLITAGPTHESIDPVRFIGNHSSGKMGYALANSLALKGADVVLISGPTSNLQLEQSIEKIGVTSAEEMYYEVMNHFSAIDIGIFAAAVADYTPEIVSTTKIKKDPKDFSISLKKTKDILAECGEIKRDNQFLVGFALETDNELEYAKKKLRKKNLDLIVLNSLKNEGAGFKNDSNQISIIDKYNKVSEFGLKPKQEVAIDILNFIEDLNS